MLPYSENTDDLLADFEEKEEKTLTFGLDIERNRVVGMIDELEALKQRVYLKLSIEADQHIIYPYTYGLKTLDLIGKPSYYVIAVLPDRIKETLMDDDEITDVSDFTFTVNGKKIEVSFIVHTKYGEVKEETVVSY